MSPESSESGAEGESPIVVELKLHPEARDITDEWAGLADQAARRKVQNRLNRRAYRRRKAAEKENGLFVLKQSRDNYANEMSAARRVPVEPLAAGLASCIEVTPSTMLFLSSPLPVRQRELAQGSESPESPESTHCSSNSFDLTDPSSVLGPSLVSRLHLKVASQCSHLGVDIESRCRECWEGPLHGQNHSPPASTSTSIDGNLIGRVNYRPLKTRLPVNNVNDPFGTTPTQLNNDTFRLLQYFINTWVPLVFVTEATEHSLQPIRHIKPVNDLVHGYLFSNAHIYCLLATMAISIKVVYKTSLFGFENLSACVEVAVRALRNEISARMIDKRSDVDQLILQDILFLYSSDFFLGNLPAAKKHLYAMRQYLRSIGGFATVNRFIAELCVKTDIFASIQTMSPPELPVYVDPGLVPPLPYSPPRMRESLMGSRIVNGPGLSVLAAAGLLSPAMSLLLHDLESCIQVARYIWKNSDAPAANIEWMTQRLYALLHRLLSIPADSHDDRSESVRCTLLILLAHLMSPNVGRRAGCVHSTWLQQVLSRNRSRSTAENWISPSGCLTRKEGADPSFTSCWWPEQLQTQHAGVLKWILITGAFAAAAQIEEEDEAGKEEWFLSRIALLMGGEENMTYENLYAAASHFWCLVPLQCDSLRKCSRNEAPTATAAGVGDDVGGGEPGSRSRTRTRNTSRSSEGYCFDLVPETLHRHHPDVA